MALIPSLGRDMDICWLIINKIIVLEIEKALQELKQKGRGRPIFLEAATKPNLLRTTTIMLLLEMTSTLIQNYKSGKGFNWKSMCKLRILSKFASIINVIVQGNFVYLNWVGTLTILYGPRSKKILIYT